MRKRVFISPVLFLIVFILVGVGIAGASILIGGSGGTEEVNLQKGLAGWWKFDGNAKDATANSNHGTVAGAVLTADRKEQANKAYGFNGTSDYINMGSVNYGPSTGFTWSAWVKTSDVTVANQTIFSHADSASCEDMRLTFNADTASQFAILVDPSGACVDPRPKASSSITVSNNVWYHVAGVMNYANGKLIIYVNGANPQETVWAGTPLNRAMYGSIGNIHTNTLDLNYFKGSMDDVRIYNRALSATEVAALYDEYDSGVKISNLQRGLVGHWRMDGNAKDATANSNHGSVSGATLTTDRKGTVNSAYNFDGVANNINLGPISSHPGINFNGATAVSFAAWVYWTGVSPPNGYSMLLSPNYVADGIVFGIYSGGRCAQGLKNAYSFNVIGSDGDISQNQWLHLVWTWDKTGGANNLKCYINGSLKRSATTTANSLIVDTSDQQLIGRSLLDTSSDWNPFKGSMDDVRIYNRALSATEVAALYDEYDSGVKISNLQRGLVGHWRMDGNGKDATANSSHGTVTGATLAMDRKGQALKAYSFDGNDSIDQNTYSAALDLTTTYTIALWFKSNSSTNYAGLVGKAKALTDGAIAIYRPTSNKLRFHTYDGVGYAVDDLDVNVWDNSWHHVVIAVNNSVSQWYLDGTSNGAASDVSSRIPYSGAGTELWRIGKYQPAGAYGDAVIDDVRIYNRALTAAEVLSLYQSY